MTREKKVSQLHQSDLESDLIFKLLGWTVLLYVSHKDLSSLCSCDIQKYTWAHFASKRPKVQRLTGKKSQSPWLQWRKSSTCQTPPVPASTVPRSPVSVTTIRHSLPHPYGGKKKPLKFIIQCIFHTPARAASLPEKQVVTNHVTLSTTNDPKAEGSSEIMPTLSSFPNYWSTRHRTRGNSHGWELPNSPCCKKTSCYRSYFLLLQWRATLQTFNFL